MNFIQLPSGLILNTDQIAYIEETELDWFVCFASAPSDPQDSEALHVVINKKDAEALISWLKANGMKIVA